MQETRKKGEAARNSSTLDCRSPDHLLTTTTAKLRMPFPPLQRFWASVATLWALFGLALSPALSNAYVLPSCCLSRQRFLFMNAGHRTGGVKPLSQSSSAWYSRADVFRGGLVLLPGAMLTCLAPWGVRPVSAAEEEKEKVESSTFIPFVASSKTFTFDYPDSWKLAPKLVQTHQEEVRGCVVIMASQ